MTRHAPSKAFPVVVYYRLVLSIILYSVAAIYPQMQGDIGGGIAGLGLVTSGFLVGFGSFQIVGGFFTLRYGPKKLTYYGMLVATVSTLLSAGVSGLPELVILRVVSGLGLGMSTAPGIMLAAKYYREGSEGVAIGLFYSAHWLGGIIGVFGWVLLASAIGWRVSILLSGLLGIMSAFLLVLAVPPDPRISAPPQRFPSFRDLIPSGYHVWDGFAILGSGLPPVLFSGFLVYYLEKGVGVEASLAGLVVSLSFVSALAGAPLGGRLYDRFRNPRILLLASGMGAAAGVFLAAIGSVVAAALASVVGGLFASAAIAIGVTVAREVNPRVKGYETLNVSWVNEISLCLSSLFSEIFAIQASQSYGVAWVSAGGYIVILSLAALKLRKA